MVCDPFPDSGCDAVTLCRIFGDAEDAGSARAFDANADPPGGGTAARLAYLRQPPRGMTRSIA